MTAGHVDHGKSTLVRLLTGTDPDRWEDEKRRGLTIDLGFAWMAGSEERSASRIAFIDVPGHQGFLANMLAGCGAVDLALLVVSAREGWMAQTEEHTQILDLLDITRGLVALTHADVVDPSAVDATARQITARLAGTTLEGSPIMATSPNDPSSIDALRASLLEAAASTVTGTTDDRRRPRLWIDRSFRLHGTGRVVTGTLAGGHVSLGDDLSVVGVDGENPATVRGLHVNGSPVDRAPPGSRVGVALSRLKTDPVRGDALVRPGQWTGGRRWHVALRRGRTQRDPLVSRAGYHVFVGTAHSPAQLRFSHDNHDHSSDKLGALLGRLHLRDSIAPLGIGDRFVLRDEGTNRTVGGGVILAIDDDLHRYAETELAARWRILTDDHIDREEGTGRLATALLAEAGGVMEAETLARQLGPLDQITTEGVERAGPHVLHAELARRRRDQILNEVHDADAMPELHDPLSRIVTDQLVIEGVIERRSGTLRAAGSRSSELQRAIQRITEMIEAAEPPLLTAADLQSRLGSEARDRSQAIQAGAVVEVGPFLTTPVRFAHLADAVEEAIGDGCTTVSGIRSRLGLSRKYVLPLLETLDHVGRTARHGDDRVWIAETTRSNCD